MDEQLWQRTLEKRRLREELDLKITDYNTLQEINSKNVIELMIERQKNLKLEYEKKSLILQLKEK